MHRSHAIAWVVSVCSVSLRLSQAKTLAILVASAMRVQRISLANIGRMMEGKVKHQIKRCWRFCANDRVETADAMRGVVTKLLKKRKKKLLVAVDCLRHQAIPDAPGQRGAQGTQHADRMG